MKIQTVRFFAYAAMLLIAFTKMHITQQEAETIDRLWLVWAIADVSGVNRCGIS